MKQKASFSDFTVHIFYGGGGRASRHVYMGTSLIKKRHPVGPYGMPIPGASPMGAGVFL